MSEPRQRPHRNHGPARWRLRRSPLASVVAMLAVSNVVTNRWLPRAAYVPWNLAVAAGLVSLARQAGHSGTALGWDQSALRRGSRTGALGMVLVAGGCAALVASGRSEGLLRDRRLTSLDTRSALSHLLVRIPVGTALAEEVMFRGVLPAILSPPHHPRWVAGTASSLLFGLWHVLPSRDRSRANGAPPGSGGSGLAVTATTLAGIMLHVLRRRTGHLAAPIAVHAAANAAGFVAVRLVDRRR